MGTLSGIMAGMAIGVVVFLVIDLVGPGVRVALTRLVMTKRAGRRGHRFSRFADYLESGIRRMDESRGWRDYQFVDPEAEVESTPSSRPRLLGHLFRAGRGGVRRVPSLSNALLAAAGPITLLEGEPGAGKSVALRHVALHLLRRRIGRVSTDEVFPLYVDLSSYQPPGGKPTAASLRSHVLQQLNRAASRDVAQFLDEEFDRSLVRGTWLFLFDSFDEIPAVAAASEPVVDSYFTAVEHLVSDGRCKAVVASRPYKQPARPDLTKIRIAPLTDRGRHELISRLDLPREQEAEIVQQIGEPGWDGRWLSRNVLFLTLLCEYVREHHALPSTSHEVLESCVTWRLTHTEQALVIRRVDFRMVRSVAEHAAYLMVTSPAFGLIVEHDILREELRKRGFRPDDVDDALYALRHSGLARRAEPGDDRFAFLHRQFQEYFAGSHVLRQGCLDPTQARSLISSPMWRETVVTLLRRQDEALLATVVDAMVDLLDPVDAELSRRVVDVDATVPLPELTLPEHTSHLLGLIDAALASGVPSREPARIRGLRMVVGSILTAIWIVGRRQDLKWVLDVVRGADPATTVAIVSEGLLHESDWVSSTAYGRLDRLDSLSEEQVRRTKKSIVGRSCERGFLADTRTIEARLRRLATPETFVDTVRLLVLAPVLDVCLTLLAIIWFFVGWSPFSGDLLMRSSLLASVLCLGAVVAYGAFAISKRASRFCSSSELTRLDKALRGFSAATGTNSDSVCLVCGVAMRGTLLAVLLVVGETAGVVSTVALVVGFVIASAWSFSALHHATSADSVPLPRRWWAYPGVVATRTAMALGAAVRARLPVERPVLVVGTAMAITATTAVCVTFVLVVLVALGQLGTATMSLFDQHVTATALEMGAVCVIALLVALYSVVAAVNIGGYLRQRISVAKVRRGPSSLDQSAVRDLLESGLSSASLRHVVTLAILHRLTITREGVAHLAEYAATVDFLARQTGDGRRPREEVMARLDRTCPDQARALRRRRRLDDHLLDDIARLALARRSDRW